MIREKLKQGIIDLAKSGMQGKANAEVIRKVVMLNVISLIAILTLVPLGTLALAQGNRMLGILDFGFASSLVGIMIFLRRSENYKRTAYWGISFAGGFFIYCLVTGGVNNTAFVWYYTFPLFASFLLGSKRGLIASLLLLVPAVFIFVVEIPLSHLATYSKEFKMRFIPSYLVVLLYAFLFENIREKTQRRLIHKNNELNENIQELNETKRALQLERNELERRVHKRTTALRRSNEALLEEISEREKAQGELKEAYNIINESPSVAFLWKNEEGWPVEFVSENAVGLFGITAEEFMSGRVVYSELIHPEDLAKVSADVEKYSAFRETVKFRHTPYRIITAQGDVKWVEDKTYIRRNQKGEITHYQGIVEDVSDRIMAHLALLEAKKDLETKVESRTKELLKANENLQAEVKNHKATENNLRKAKKAAETANQTKSEFLANMSHELRTPLNHIIGFTELIVDGQFGSLNETQREYLYDVLQSSRHLHALINDILDLSKVEAGKLIFEPLEVDLRGILDNSLILIKEKALKHGIKIYLETNGIPPTIRADERKLKQIMYNLLSNAAKFTPDGGEIHVEAKKISDDPFRTEGATGSGNSRLLIAVRDTGIGMENEDLERIFLPFEQLERATNRRYHGTGLGLALTKSLVELHKGRIWAESEGEGKGSCLIFTIPLRESD
jgi:PAS domain S-box-containing protein